MVVNTTDAHETTPLTYNDHVRELEGLILRNRPGCLGQLVQALVASTGGAAPWILMTSR